MNPPAALWPNYLLAFIGGTLGVVAVYLLGMWPTGAAGCYVGAFAGTCIPAHYRRWKERPTVARVLLRDEKYRTGSGLTGRELVRRSNGWLTPGNVYPLLARLEDAGHVARVGATAPYVYVLTDEGRKHA